MGGRNQGIRLTRIAARHPGLIAVSSAAVVAGLSVTERLIQRRSRRRSTPKVTSPEPASAEGAPPRPETPWIYREGRRAVRRLRKKPGDEHWRALRRHTDELGRRAELVAPARSKQIRKLARQAQRLSLLLGQDHDLAVLGELVREHPEQLGPEDLRLIGELIDRRRAELRQKARRLAERLYRLKPAEFARRLG